MLASLGASNATQLLRAAGDRGLFLGFSAASCQYCKPHESEWEKYAALLEIPEDGDGPAAVADGAAGPKLPGIARVDADVQLALTAQHEVTDLPSLVLAWSDHWTAYAGPHSATAMAAFGAAQLAPAAIELKSETELQALIVAQQQLFTSKAPKKAKRSALRLSPPLLLLGFFSDPHEDESDELEDFVQAARELRKFRTDVPVRGAYIRLTPSLERQYIHSLRWIAQAPSAVLLIGGEVSEASNGAVGAAAGAGGGSDAIGGGGGAWSKYAYRLDVKNALSLSEWAARAALPLLGELTPLTFAAYAAASLPMLIAFVDRSDRAKAAAGKALKRALRAIAARFRGRIVVMTCDGKGQRTRMISLGLDADGQLPQLAFNTKDGRQLPFPHGQPLTEQAIGAFAEDFLGDRLKPLASRSASRPASKSSPSSKRKPQETYVQAGGKGGKKRSGKGGGKAGATMDDGETTDWRQNVIDAVAGATNPTAPSTTDVVDLNDEQSFERTALDVTKDVLLLLHAADGCQACADFVPYYQKVGQRAKELGLTRSLVVARLDVKVHTPLPKALKAMSLHDLPTLIILPAKRKEPPFRLFHGDARPKELLYFAQAHSYARAASQPASHARTARGVGRSSSCLTRYKGVREAQGGDWAE